MYLIVYTNLEVENDGPYETKYNRGFAIGNVRYVNIYKFDLKKKRNIIIFFLCFRNKCNSQNIYREQLFIFKSRSKVSYILVYHMALRLGVK